MKKTVGLLSVSFLGAGLFFYNESANAENSFKEIVINENEVSSLSNSLEDETYYFYRLEEGTLTEEQAQDLTGESFKINNQDITIQGVSVYHSNGNTYSSLFFDELDVLDEENVKQRALKDYEVVDGLEVGIQQTEFRSSNFTVRDRYNSDAIMANFTSNLEVDNRGTSSGSDVIDVRYFNEVEPANSYQTRALTTNSSSNGSIQSYGPTENTGSGSTVSVGLSGLVPNISWSFSTLNSSITNQSSISSGYAQWQSDIPLGTSGSQNTFVTEPGVRYVSDSSRFTLYDEYEVHMYRNLSAEDIRTFSVTRFFNDL
ncbi:hypothetical protein [Shouchella lehensis]|uniref:Beta-channel forming cytolysin n=1 Tax=Shouchella lehensis TaxID=300825 RepID=A0A4Y7WM11_9BACI|nr:hypothetical protein [Shouchella lehensis]MBG9783096.1 hypothetical protein [Shouchella lehensis]TES49542.1 hypothetical protein E2L03_08730 [Shouchella lehensis]